MLQLPTQKTTTTDLCFVGLLCCAALVAQAAEKDSLGEHTNATTHTDITEEMQLINKSLEGLLSELAAIKREATGRLSQVKRAGGLAASDNNERIRQTKVSRFVLKRVAELESESLGMRDEMNKLFELQRKTISARSSAKPKQEDVDFDELPVASSHGVPSSTTTTTTTMKPAEQEQEAAQIGFDLEQLKRLGEEIGKRLDQFGKEAAKNIGELMEGIKLVFREPKKPSKPSQSAGL